MCDKCGCSESETEKTFEDKVKDVIEVIRPSLQDHGGDVELVGTDDNNTVLAL
ncbi:MAG: NifU family protein [Planctomycetota bacterium]|jgi:Fe-S cluster biogenesis protein NfuA